MLPERFHQLGPAPGASHATSVAMQQDHQLTVSRPHLKAKIGNRSKLYSLSFGILIIYYLTYILLRVIIYNYYVIILLRGIIYYTTTFKFMLMYA